MALQKSDGYIGCMLFLAVRLYSSFAEDCCLADRLATRFVGRSTPPY